MEEILHHLECIKPYKYWDIYYINWCRISSINSITSPNTALLSHYYKGNHSTKNHTFSIVWILPKEVFFSRISVVWCLYTVGGVVSMTFPIFKHMAIQVHFIKISKFQPGKNWFSNFKSKPNISFETKTSHLPSENLLRNLAQVTGGVDFAAGHTRAAGDKWSAPGTTRLGKATLDTKTTVWQRAFPVGGFNPVEKY